MGCVYVIGWEYMSWAVVSGLLVLKDGKGKLGTERRGEEFV